MNAAAPSTPPKVIDRDEEARKYSKKIEVCTTFVERDATGLLFNQQVEGTRPARPNLYANVFLYRQGNVNQTPHYYNFTTIFAAVSRMIILRVRNIQDSLFYTAPGLIVKLVAKPNPLLPIKEIGLHKMGAQLQNCHLISLFGVEGSTQIAYRLEILHKMTNL